MALRQAGVLNFNKLFSETRVDTIVLLSDGTPMTYDFPASKLMDPELVLNHAREWNKDKVVRWAGATVVA